jgi:Rhodopirellula transposase DDE domain/Transmembrane secretion effector
VNGPTSRRLRPPLGCGSNGYRTRAWKAEIAALALETGLRVTVCHFPPGTSKWNKVGHRLFSHITMNWRGRPLTSHEVIVNTIAAATTRAGLTVRAGLDPGSYPDGVKVSDQQMACLPLDRHDWHGDWNYTLRPEPPAPPPPPRPPAREPERAAWAHPARTGLATPEWEQMIAAQSIPCQAQRDAALYVARGGPPTRKPVGGHPPARTLAEQVLVTVLRQRLRTPQLAAGMALPFISESVCVLAGVVLIWKVRLPVHGARGQHARVRDDIREGWRWLWAHAAVRTLAITIFTFNVTFGAAWSVLVLYARERLGMGALGFGLITTAMAVGRPAGHRVLRLAGAARTAGRHHARRADHRDADPPCARADPLGLVRADRLRDLRCARVYLGNDIDERAAAGCARPVPRPRRQCLPHRRGRRHRDRVRPRRAGRLGLGRHRAVLVRLRRIDPHPRGDLAFAAAYRTRRRARPSQRPHRSGLTTARAGTDRPAASMLVIVVATSHRRPGAQRMFCHVARQLRVRG